MATSSPISALSVLPRSAPIVSLLNQQLSLFNHRSPCSTISQPKKKVSFRVQAAKLPPGVELPKVEPKFEAPFLGFTRTAEIWNSRACMIGLIGIFIVELILNKGILQVLGVDIGKGLDLPLWVHSLQYVCSWGYLGVCFFDSFVIYLVTLNCKCQGRACTLSFMIQIAVICILIWKLRLSF